MNRRTSIGTVDSDLMKSVNRSLDLLKSGELEEAEELFNRILKIDYKSDIADTGIKCCRYWASRIAKFLSMKENFESSKYLFDEWKKFESFYKSFSNFNGKVVHNIMYYIYHRALDVFNKDLRSNIILDAQFSFMIARAYKEIGDYKNALVKFEETLKVDQKNSNVLAQIADVYSLIDDDAKAKLIFREAFFVEPEAIDIDLLDSNLINALITRLKTEKVAEDELKYWIPVYGRVFNIFNVYREILPVEFGKLSQEIFFLEGKIGDFRENKNIVTARLLNCYFWLYDYYKNKNSGLEYMSDLELKIKKVSEKIYKEFINYGKKELV